jgi:two-component system phosphate regulon sensor histidine kinase PhoR
MEQAKLTYEELQNLNNELRIQLEEATDAIEAIRTGRVDALVVNNGGGHQLYTLKTADQTYRVFIEKMNEGAVTVNREGLILYCNTAFASMVGLPLEKVIGLEFNSFIYPSDAEKFDKLIGNAWERDCKEELTLVKSKGEGLYCLLSCNTLELDEGLALSLILTDLSILKEAENKLRIKNLQLAAAHLATEQLNNQLEDIVRDRTKELYLSREHFKYLANNIPQMTWTNLPDGEPDYYNQQWYVYTGLNFEESKAGGWEKVIHPDDLAATNERYLTALKAGDAFEMENRYKRASDGAYRWHLNRAVPLKNEDGEIVFWVGTATDIEDQKKEMEKRDEFIGIASHELKTPLTSLKGYLQLITSTKKDDVPPKVVQYVEKANKALGKLQSLINDLLDVSKIRAGKLEYAFDVINISDLITACIENAEHIYPENTFENKDGNEFLVNGNLERLEQVLMNFISNAVKYSHQSKKVIIKSERKTNCVRVSVIDFGIGLSQDQKEHIFERFYRVEDKKFLTSGLGMGLYISAEIVHNHGGEIGVEGELDNGCTFYFELPLVKLKAES